MSEPSGNVLGEGFVGFIVSVESYTEARAFVYNPGTRLLRYGALALVEDPRGERSYLALVVDVREHSLMPSVDEERLRQISRLLAARGAEYRDALQVARQLLSPSSSLVRWYSTRELKLRILGELAEDRLAIHEAPPRLTSIVREPPSELLERIVSRGLSVAGRGLYLGTLAYNPEVRVYLDPERLTTHLAVLGQTGSGKTETVKRIVAEYAWRKQFFSNGGGVVVFDVAGEYTGYPYSDPRVVPLLDAALNPSAFTSINASWLTNTRKTVLVPYDLSVISLYQRAEQVYAGDIAAMLEQLAGRYNAQGYRATAVLYARHHIYLVEPHREPRPISRGEAAQLLRAEPFLVVAAPLPDTLRVEEIAELARTRSEYFSLVVADMADRLGLLALDTVVSVKSLAAVAQLTWRTYQSLRSGDRSPHAVASRIRSIVQNVINNVLSAEPPERCRAVREAFENQGQLHGVFVDCPAWGTLLSLPLVLQDPAVDPWSVVEQALDTRIEDTGQTWRETLLRGARLAAQALTEQSWQTMASVVRGLDRVARMVSPLLDAAHYRLLAQRLLEGFSIVHLAPPSRGDTDAAVSRLLDELFHVSVANYRRGRRSLIVVEEAHNLAPTDEDRASKASLLRIAREGRKWGLSLVLVSQRPGFIDPGILSQAATMIALRITNPDDLAGIKRGVESASQEIVERLPDLEPGQALVSGLAVPERRIPLLTRVEMLRPRT
ncbi:ATP-binding protein [Pyrodictium abyssi]|uniref:ATP-binding protein n=1 Tax=Pyrodictium abyssi TaxID=54256 RepID=UPI0030C6BB14